MDRLRVLNPPVAAMLKAWFKASKKGIPAAHRESRIAVVSDT